MKSAAATLTKAVLTDQMPPPLLQTEHRIIIDKMYVYHQKHTKQVLDAAFDELFLFFENHKLYVMYEDLLRCDPLTDHLQPKNVLPVFYDALQCLKSKLVGRLGLSSLVSFEYAVRYVFSEQSEYNASLVLEKHECEAQSSTRLKLAESLHEMLESYRSSITYLKRQHLTESVQILEQIQYLTRSASVYSPDLSLAQKKDASADKAAKEKDAISYLNDKLVELQARNLHLLQDNQKLVTAKAYLEFQLQYRDSLIGELNTSMEQMGAHYEQNETVISLKNQSVLDLERKHEEFTEEREILQQQLFYLSKKCREYEELLKKRQFTNDLLLQKYEALYEALSKRDHAFGEEKQHESCYTYLTGRDRQNAQYQSKIAGVEDCSGKLTNADLSESEVDKLQRSQLLYELLLEQAKRDVKYFGLKDSDIVAKMYQNGDKSRFLARIRDNLFASEVRISIVVADFARNAISELKSASDAEVISYIQAYKSYPYYFAVAKENCFKKIGEMDVKWQEKNDGRAMPEYTSASGGNLTTDRPIDRQQSNYANTGEQHIVSRIETDQKSYNKLQLQKDINDAVNAVARLNTIGDFVTELVRAEAARDVGIYVGSSQNYWYRTSHRSLELNGNYSRPPSRSQDKMYTKAGKSQQQGKNGFYPRYSDSFGDISFVTDESEKMSTLRGEFQLSIEDLMSTGRKDYIELARVIAKRGQVANVFERLFKDAYIYQQRLLYIQDRYFKSRENALAIREQAVEASISMYISYFTQYMDVIKLAIYFDEQPVETELVISSSIYPARKHETGRFGFLPGGDRFIELPPADAMRISRPVSSAYARDSSVCIYESIVEYSRPNSMLLSFPVK